MKVRRGETLNATSVIMLNKSSGYEGFVTSETIVIVTGLEAPRKPSGETRIKLFDRGTLFFSCFRPLI